MRIGLLLVVALTAGCSSMEPLPSGVVEVVAFNAHDQALTVAVEAQEHHTDLDAWATFVRLGARIEPGGSARASEGFTIEHETRLLVATMEGGAAYRAFAWSTCPSWPHSDDPMRLEVTFTSPEAFDAVQVCPDGQRYDLRA